MPEKAGNSRRTKMAGDVLAFDTESRITVDQSLTFGVWRRCKLVGQNYEVIEEGIFLCR